MATSARYKANFEFVSTVNLSNLLENLKAVSEKTAVHR